MLQRVGGQQGGAPVGEQELVQIAVQAVAGLHVGDRLIGVVCDHVGADAVAVHDLPLPPRERGPALVDLHLEVVDLQAGRRVLPDGPTRRVGDHRAGLSVRGAVGADEDQARGGSALAEVDRE